MNLESLQFPLLAAALASVLANAAFPTPETAPAALPSDLTVATARTVDAPAPAMDAARSRHFAERGEVEAGPSLFEPPLLRLARVSARPPAINRGGRLEPVTMPTALSACMGCPVSH